MTVSPLVSRIVSIDPGADFGVVGEDLQKTLDNLEMLGYGVDTREAPIFYEASTNYLNCDSNIGSLMGAVRRNVLKSINSDRVSAEDRHTISNAISMSVMKSKSFDEALSNLLLWSGQSDEEEE